MTKGNKIGLVVGISVTVVVLIAVIVSVVVLLNHEKNVAPVITLDGTVLDIKDTYKKHVDLAGATVTLEIEGIRVVKRLAGTSMDKIQKGKFELESGEKAYLSMMAFGDEYIKIVLADGSKLFINRTSPDETRSLYNKISAALANG